MKATTIKISPRGTITLPRPIRRRFALSGEDILIVEATAQGILLKPASVYPTELYSEARLAEFEKNNNAALKDVFPDRRKKHGPRE